MTKLKGLMLTGSIAVLTVSGAARINSAVNAENTTEESNKIVVESTQTDDGEEEYTFNFDDEDLKDFKVTFENDFKVDYSKLTEDEKKELLAIYDRVEEIFAEIFPEDLSDCTEDEIEARLEKFEDEIEKLGERSAELEKKAGWTDSDAVVSFITNIDNEELISKTSTFIDTVTDEAIEKIADDIIDELKSISDDDIEKFVKDVRDDLDIDFGSFTDEDIEKLADDIVDEISSITSEDIDKFVDEAKDELDKITDEDIENFINDFLDGFGAEED